MTFVKDFPQDTIELDDSFVMSERFLAYGPDVLPTTTMIRI